MACGCASSSSGHVGCCRCGVQLAGRSRPAAACSAQHHRRHSTAGGVKQHMPNMVRAALAAPAGSPTLTSVCQHQVGGQKHTTANHRGATHVEGGEGPLGRSVGPCACWSRPVGVFWASSSGFGADHLAQQTVSPTQIHHSLLTCPTGGQSTHKAFECRLAHTAGLGEGHWPAERVADHKSTCQPAPREQ